jgi:hypothetical protein
MGRGKKNARKIAAQKSRGQTNMSFQLKDLYDDPLATAKTYGFKNRRNSGRQGEAIQRLR